MIARFSTIRVRRMWWQMPKKYFVLKGFTENQAQCILDVRIKSCCKEQKEKVYREMEMMDKLCIVEPQSILPSMNENKITI